MAGAGIAERPTRARTKSRRAARQPRRQPGWRAVLGRVRPGEAEGLLVLALFGLAIVARLPHLQTIPHYTDEIVEVSFSRKIALGQDFPLTAKDTYFGPLHYYILAAFLKVFGPNIAIPRLIIMVFGALTVLAVYLLGREIAGRAVGALAAALLLTSPQHILINSHIAWQNSTMPLYSTLCCWALVKYLNGERRGTHRGGSRSAERGAGAGGKWASGRWLVLCGFLFGLTLQTHPGAVVLVPALGATFLVTLWVRRGWRALRAPWPYLAGLAAVVAYSPILIFNLANNLTGLRRVVYQRDYAYEMNPTWERYRENLGNLALQLCRTLSDPTRLPTSTTAYFDSPYLPLMLALCLGGLALLARRGQWLPLFLLLSTLAIVPRYLRAYVLPSDYFMAFARYVAYLIPLLYVAIGAAIVTLGGAVWRALAARPGIPWARWAALAVSVALVGYLVLAPLLPLARFYEKMEWLDPNNTSYATMMREVGGLRGERAPLIVDNYLDKVVSIEGVSARDVVVYLLEMADIPFVETSDARGELARLAAMPGAADPSAAPLLITMRDRCWAMRDTIPLQRASDRLRLRELYRDLPSYFAIYRYAPSPAVGGCFGPEGPQPGD